jgi:FMN reductase
MRESKLQVLAVIGTLSQVSLTQVVVEQIAEGLRAKGCSVDIFNPVTERLDLFNPDLSHSSASYRGLQKRVEAADVFVLGTPDYHGSISSTLKNFLDHFWPEFAGKLFASVVASPEKGLTVTDQLRTVARQCYAWTLPYGVSFVDRKDVKMEIATQDRLEMMIADICNYGKLLAERRARDLEGSEPGFMARHRAKEPANVMGIRH